jgi:lysozyme
MRRSTAIRTAAALALLAALGVAPPVAAGGAGSSGHVPSRQPRPVIRVLEAVALPPPTMLIGIDVSHWQGTVDWPAVHAAGVSFAYIKATDGPAFIDDQYARNRGAATETGIVVGAYHLGRPSAVAGDGTLEADRFLDVAAPAPGDLVPALDLEDDGGLAPDALVRWTLEFVARVRERVGVAPVVYVSPAFWTAKLDDALVVAGWGSPLWVAHWRTATPRLPADGWQGRGWTVWQWSNRGLVTGIEGEVDLDVLAGLDLSTLQLP